MTCAARCPVAVVYHNTKTTVPENAPVDARTVPAVEFRLVPFRKGRLADVHGEHG